MKRSYLFYILFIFTFLFIPNKAYALTRESVLNKLTTDGENVTVKAIKPTSYESAYDLMNNIFYNLIDDDRLDVTADCVEPDFTNCSVMVQSLDDTLEFQEIYNVKVTYDEPKTDIEFVNKYLAKIAREINDDSDYYVLTDLSLINYYNTSEKSELWNPGAAGRAIKYVKEINDILDNSNFTFGLPVGMGEQDSALMYETAGGGFTLYYNGYAYGTTQAGIYLKRVIYIPEDTENTKEAYVLAAQKRINEYLGNEDVLVSYGGPLTNLVNEIDETSYFYEDDTVTYEELMDPSILEDDTDGNYYFIKIKNRTYKFYIMKSSSDKLISPTYQGYNVDTKINVSSSSSSIPLDTIIEAKKVNTELKDVINTDNYISYDINLYSNGKNDYIKKLDNGKFVVTINVPENLNGKKLIVYYITNDNKLEEHTVVVDDDKNTASFETDHFSTYTLAEKIETSNESETTETNNEETTETETKVEEVKETTTTENPKTGDKIVLYLAILLISVIGIISLGLYVHNR